MRSLVFYWITWGLTGGTKWKDRPHLTIIVGNSQLVSLPGLWSQGNILGDFSDDIGSSLAPSYQRHSTFSSANISFRSNRSGK